MSKLPEYKKSPEEIAALRDRLGVRPPAETPPAPAPDPFSDDEPVVLRETVENPPVRPLHDLPDVQPAPIDEETGLPVKRHTADELAALRLRGMFDTQDGALTIPVRRERTVFVLCGYALAASAAIPVFHEMPAVLPVSMTFAALAYAAYLFICRPYSRHHGAFIAMLVLFVWIYAALQYFPQLRHAT